MQKQGEAAYNKEGKAATSNNRALALADEWQDFKDGIVFNPLRPEEAQKSASLKKADVPSAGLATEGNHKMPMLHRRAALLCGAVAAVALSAAAVQAKRS